MGPGFSSISPPRSSTNSIVVSDLCCGGKSSLWRRYGFVRYTLLVHRPNGKCCCTESVIATLMGSVTFGTSLGAQQTAINFERNHKNKTEFLQEMPMPWAMAGLVGK